MEKAKHRNGVRHSWSTKQRAIALRHDGKTHREITKELGISLGSAYAWTRSVKLSFEQKRAIRQRIPRPMFSQERRERLRLWARVHLAPFREKYTKEDLLNKIRIFFEEHGRIPLKREFNMYGEYQRRFGSWNSAIRLAGFEPHQVVFSKKFTAQDGHVCDSFAEKIIDDWLSKNGLEHERNVRYRNTRMTADFAAGRARIEYFGLAGEDPLYDQMIRRKRRFCRENDLTLIEIYPRELFSNSESFKSCLGKVLKETRTHSLRRDAVVSGVTQRYRAPHRHFD